MDFRHHLRLMAGWHVWAFERLYESVDRAGEADYRKDAGLFFKSIHGSLNHMLLVEHLWRGRLTGNILKIESLADELEADRSRLKKRLFESARSWRPYVDAMPEIELDGDLTFTSTTGQSYTLPRAGIVHALFTHAAHHRGQVSAVLTQLGLPAPVMDYPYYLDSLPRGQLRSP